MIILRRKKLWLLMAAFIDLCIIGALLLFAYHAELTKSEDLFLLLLGVLIIASCILSPLFLLRFAIRDTFTLEPHGITRHKKFIPSENIQSIFIEERLDRNSRKRKMLIIRWDHAETVRIIQSFNITDQDGNRMDLKELEEWCATYWERLEGE